MKKALLIAGGGTLGSYTAEELLRLGHKVDVICLEDKVSDNENLRYFKAPATVEYLEALFADNHYDGIVNFLHFKTAEAYEPYHALLSKSTEHLIFLSSYRVYADLEHPITEEAPQLLDVIKNDPKFLEVEDYALAKCRIERFLRGNPYPVNWTIVRPVISFSERRFDILLHTAYTVIDAFRKGECVELPLEAKELIAGFDWAGNSGKIIANLLFKTECIGDAYTVSSAENLTWGEVADMYTELLGVNFRWIPADFPKDDYRWYYDRAYDRRIDNSKLLKATGLSKKDFTPIKEGLKIELKKAGLI